jgi:NADPH:quinone reductase-like Zn-dependent oxidoreductase
MRRLCRFIVHNQEQVDFLTKLGPKFVVNSSSDTLKKDVYKAIDATDATLAFDAIRGLDFSPTLLNYAFGMTPK